MLLLVVFNPLGTLAWAEDHLEPETGLFTSHDWEWVYARNIRENRPKDMGSSLQAWLICCTSFAPEWVVSVVRQGEGELFTKGTRAYFVEYVEAQRRVWNDEKKSVKVGVKRVRVGLHPAAAEAVSDVWHRMLFGVRNPGVRSRSDDGVVYHFSRATGPMIEGGPLSGLGTGGPGCRMKTNSWVILENSLRLMSH